MLRYYYDMKSIKPETKKKIKNITIEVIDFFLGLPETIMFALDRKDFYNNLSDSHPELTCSNIAKIISNLKRSGYIEIEKDKYNNESVVFTNKAKLAVVDKLVKRHPKSRRYCFVSFDIPERMRLNRDQFRRAIKRMGFIKIQKSLWVINRNVGKYVEMAALEYKVNDYVVYLVTEVSNIDAFLLKTF